ncbi:1-aminocyclopropane-1-carboxylate deaminase/D-cysteine desulfhydrase [Teredinibacter sp. KSP-S5-2]|uniref:1-aminocyclopropane-1-carboxylate deaminase/D-cysteine desulfhydrase n=1 Tax=Teredinibacter sp. KSP-S5-2 TaxID=3034506 RepID=UPI0029344F49|nr:pyridoxal-phosphate dependent enzyme [Teredinibacter sp. KSP-S5-2]WNO11069.1 pyridoxal-phosphate dependent enzyme [Teredinibacter sp. KSP-S5-2]
MLAKRGLSLVVKREDQLDANISGNKFYKLWGHLQAYKQFCFESRTKPPLATFGGAYSNHIHATAAAGKLLGIPTVGVIRGERTTPLNPSLQDAEEMGMRLEFVSRSDYQNRHELFFQDTLESRLGKCFWVPEGGSGSQGITGCIGLGRVLGEYLQGKNGVVCMACGTATTLAGVRIGMAEEIPLLGVSALKGEGMFDAYLSSVFAQHGLSSTNLIINYGYHCGGYAKFPQYLMNFMRDFETSTGVLLDPVYTGKLMWAICQLAEQDYWKEGTKIVALHSGGLQGRRGVPQLEQRMSDV